MTWIADLDDVYNSNLDFVGKKVTQTYGSGDKQFTRNAVLQPIAHISVQVAYEVEISEDGEFQSARPLAKEEATTTVPTTIDGSIRTSKSVPLVVHDKFKYVARDYGSFVDKEKQAKNPAKKIKPEGDEAYQAYLKQLEGLVNSKYTLPEFEAVYNYLSNHDLIGDMQSSGVFEESGIKDLKSSDLNCFVRFKIRGAERQLWENPAAFDSWKNYYLDELNDDKNKGLDYISGKISILTDKHLGSIRHAGDKAKLISANDSSNFTYRGRFTEPAEAATISFENSQKAMLALKWLIELQGFELDDRVFVSWAVVSKNNGKGAEKPLGINRELNVNSVISSRFGFPIKANENQPAAPNTQKKIAEEFNKELLTGKGEISPDTPIAIMELDAATPGRLEITHYETMEAQDYIRRVINWYSATEYPKDHTPYLRNLAENSYASKSKSSVIKNTISRLLGSVIDGQSIPVDIVDRLVKRAIKPLAFKDGEYPSWDYVMQSACQLIKASSHGKYSLSLDENSNDRSYLFGQLLATADLFERSYLRARDLNRPTNAQRYMSRFMVRPVSTWKQIVLALQPIMKADPESAKWLQLNWIEIMAKFADFSDFSDRPLKHDFLLGFSQKEQQIFKKEKVGSKFELPVKFFDDKDCTDSDYLFGKLLSICSYYEMGLLHQKEADRLTSALLYLREFSNKPMTTLNLLVSSLISRLDGKQAYYFQSEISRIIGKFSPAEYEDFPLSGTFLLGYIHELWELDSRQKNQEFPDDLTFTNEYKDRSYLYGRLLAIADKVETVYLASHKIDRVTNAKKFMRAFTLSPASSWKEISRRLSPYLAKNSKKEEYQGEIQDIERLLLKDDQANQRLSGKFLLGYGHEQNILRNKTI